MWVGVFYRFSTTTSNAEVLGWQERHLQEYGRHCTIHASWLKMASQAKMPAQHAPCSQALELSKDSGAALQFRKLSSAWHQHRLIGSNHIVIKCPVQVGRDRLKGGPCMRQYCHDDTYVGTMLKADCTQITYSIGPVVTLLHDVASNLGLPAVASHSRKSCTIEWKHAKELGRHLEECMQSYRQCY